MWGTIPRGTSLADIPLGLRARTRAVVNVYNAVKAYRNVGTWKSDEAKARWYSENTRTIELINWIEELRDGRPE